MKKEKFYYEPQQYGQCGRHAMNFAFGRKGSKPFETEAQYVLDVQTYHQNAGILDPLEIQNINEYTVDSEASIVAWILTEIKGKKVQLKELREIHSSIRDFVGPSEWIIMGVSGDRKGIVINGHNIPGGHFVGVRKDNRGLWWIIDSEKSDGDYTQCTLEDFDQLREVLSQNHASGKQKNDVNIIVDAGRQTTRCEIL